MKSLNFHPPGRQGAPEIILQQESFSVVPLDRGQLLMEHMRIGPKNSKLMLSIVQVNRHEML